MDVEQEFIDAWNAGKLHRVSDGAKTWVGLTDEEARIVFAAHNCDISKDLAGILARAIEAKLKEKNNGA